jgi:hypothetical protein
MKLGTYIRGAAIVWAGILLATALILLDTPYFPQVLPVLGGGVVWFLLIVPGAWRRSSSSTRRAPSGEHA